jgi:hypothetical protein
MMIGLAPPVAAPARLASSPSPSQPAAPAAASIPGPPQQSALSPAAAPSALRVQSVQDGAWLGLPNTYANPVFVGLQPTGRFVVVYNFAGSVEQNVTVYLVPSGAVSATQVTSFVIKDEPCQDAFYDIAMLAWRADGKVLIAQTRDGIMVLDFVREACYPCGGVSGLQYDTISEVAFSPDSTRLLLVLNQTTVVTLDTTQGMANAKILPPAAQLYESYIFNVPVTANGSIALMTRSHSSGDDDDNDGGGQPYRDDDDDPGIGSLALISVGPGTQPAVAAANAIYFSATFTVKPVALFGGQFLVFVQLTAATMEVRAIAAQTGRIAGKAVVDKPKGTKHAFGLQLCPLSDNEAVLFAGGFAYLVSVVAGAASGNATQVVVQDGVPVGIMRKLSGCVSQGGASLVGLYSVTHHYPTLTLLSK